MIAQNHMTLMRIKAMEAQIMVDKIQSAVSGQQRKNLQPEFERLRLLLMQLEGMAK